MTSELTMEEVQATVQRVAQEILWEVEVEAPPVDALTVARRLGCVVAAQQQGVARASRVRLRGGSQRSTELILLAAEDRPERRQWAVAHELGERYAVRVFDRLGVDPGAVPGGTREQAANQFASALLLPGGWFTALADEVDWDLYQLKQQFSSASYELIARRILDRSPSAICVTVIDNQRITWRRGNRCHPPAPIEAEHRTWQQANQTAQPVSTPVGHHGIAQVRAWPVHEADWKREITVTQFEEL